VTIAALSFHSIFEGLAIGLETSTADVWQLFGGDYMYKIIYYLTLSLQLLPSIFCKRVSSHIYGNPATFNKRERNRERHHPKPFN